MGCCGLGSWRFRLPNCRGFGYPNLRLLRKRAMIVSSNENNPMAATTKNYRVRVETYDGLQTIWFEKSRANRACDLIANRVYNQLCGLNVKEIEVTPSV